MRGRCLRRGPRWYDVHEVALMRDTGGRILHQIGQNIWRDPYNMCGYVYDNVHVAGDYAGTPSTAVKETVNPDSANAVGGVSAVEPRPALTPGQAVNAAMQTSRLDLRTAAAFDMSEDSKTSESSGCGDDSDIGQTKDSLRVHNMYTRGRFL